MFQQYRNRDGWRQLAHRPAVLGEYCIAVATFALAIAWLILADRDYPEGVAGRIMLQFGVLLVAGSALVATIGSRWHSVWFGPILFWLVLFGIGVVEAIRNVSLTAAVEPSEALVIILAIGTIIVGVRSPHLDSMAAVVAAAMLVLFGTVHLQHAAAISDLVPSWMPGRHAIPYLTGPLLVAAGLAFASGRARLIAATAIALLFLSWLPLVHVERLIRDPGSLAEWRFALTALALAGALLIVGGRRPQQLKT